MMGKGGKKKPGQQDKGGNGSRLKPFWQRKRPTLPGEGGANEIHIKGKEHCPVTSRKAGSGGRRGGIGDERGV